MGCFLMRLGLLSLVVVLASTATVAETVRLTPQSDWFGKLSGTDLQPGDEVILAAGVYSDARRLVLRLRGTADLPIVIRAADGQRVILQRPDAKQNSLNLEGCQHLILQGIEITGGAAGIRISNGSEGHGSVEIGLLDLHIHHIGGVAVTCNNEGSEYRRMRFLRNHIHHTSGHGEGFYLGANNAKAVFSEALIKDNYIHHLNGPKVSQGDGIEIKDGGSGNRVEGNIIHDTNYPGIMTYGTQGQARNQIVGNLIWNTGDHGIQVAADAVIRDNWIASTGGCGIYSREHQGAIPSNLLIEGNHVVSKANPAVRIIGSGQDADGADASILLRNNHLFSGTHFALRADNGVRLLAVRNQGTGSIQGSKAFQDSWQETNADTVHVPELKGHPAWKFLERSAVEKRLQSSD